MTLDACQRQVQSFLVRRLLLALRADVNAQLAAFDEGLIVPDEIRELPAAAARIVAAAEPLWAGVDLNGPVTYDLNPRTDEGDLTMPEIETDHYITVAKLRELLADQPDDALVVMSKDGEGNGFSPFSELGGGRYIAESSWSGYLADEGEDDDEPGEDDDVTAHPDYEEPAEQGVPCIALWPTN